MKLGLALSGGGFRATAYHLGVLARLARTDWLEEVTHLSTVSGGSLCVGLVYALSDNQWPSSQHYLDHVVPAARQQMTTYDFQVGLLRRLLRTPWRIFQTKADDLSYLMRTQWGLTIPLSALPPRPRWMINATCYETGKNWRFERFRMGDYVFGYTNNTDLPVSDALAASAGFPGLIGPLALKTDDRRWFNYRRASQEDAVEADDASEEVAPAPSDTRKTETVQPLFKHVHLWDGGVYDNHGLEGLHDFMTGWRQGIEFLLVSDGAGKPTVEQYRLRGILMRIMTGVLMDQVRSLRTRAILERIRNHGDKGVYLTIGKSCRAILAGADQRAELEPVYRNALSDADAARAGNFPTVIRKLQDAEFELLFRHGYEITDCTLNVFYSDLFEPVPYQA